MRLILSLLLAATTFIAGPGITHAEVMCTDPATPAAQHATPTLSEFPAAEFPEEGGDLHIFAAASLNDAFNEIANYLMAENPDLHITIESAGSQTLVTQLEEGAHADVLATANTSTMDRAHTSDLVNGDPVIFAGNRLVIVIPADNPAGIDNVDDLAREDVRLVLANPGVPAGDYSTTALCEYAQKIDDPEGFIARINTNLASEEPDVRHVLTRVQLGEADAGVVYASDATTSILNGVEITVIEFPESIPALAEYPITAVEGGDTELAQAFISFVLSDEGQEILAYHGFE